MYQCVNLKLGFRLDFFFSLFQVLNQQFWAFLWCVPHGILWFFSDLYLLYLSSVFNRRKQERQSSSKLKWKPIEDDIFSFENISNHNGNICVSPTLIWVGQISYFSLRYLDTKSKDEYVTWKFNIRQHIFHLLYGNEHFPLTFRLLKGLFWTFWIELDIRWSSDKFIQKTKVLSESWDSSLCWRFKISNKGSFWHNSGSSFEMELNPPSRIVIWLYLVKLAGGNFLSWLWVRFNTVMFAGRSSGIWVNFRWLQSATSCLTTHLLVEDVHSIQKGKSTQKQEMW